MIQIILIKEYNGYTRGDKIDVKDTLAYELNNNKTAVIIKKLEYKNKMVKTLSEK